MTNRSDHPKVFISYSWSSPDHEDFVLNLGENLMTNGVIVILDKWDLKEGHDKYVFMEKMVTDPTVQKVLVVSDKKYAEKADLRKGGVGTESQIISNEIYTKVTQDKFIPIVTEFADDGQPYLPTFLKNRIFIDLATQENYYSEFERLLRNIYDRPAICKPKLGAPPTFIRDDSPQEISTLQAFYSFSEAIKKEKPIAKSLSSEFLEQFVEALEVFRISTTDNVDEQVVSSIEKLKPYRDQFCQYLKLVIINSGDNEYYEQIFNFFESLLRFHHPPESVNSFNKLWFDNFKFFNMELFLYLISILIKYKKYDEVSFFLEEKYYLSHRFQRENVYFTEFNSYIPSLEELRKVNLKLNRISLTADFIHDRADVKTISFIDIMQADFILALRSILSIQDQYHYWFPRTLVYVGHLNEQPFEIFFRAEAQKHFGVLKTLLKITSKKDLTDKFNKAAQIYDFDRWCFDYRKIPFNALMNYENLFKD